MVRFLLALGIGLPIFSSIFVWKGFQERDVARDWSSTPETIPLSKLIARGPEGNSHLVLTDYVPIKPYVIQRGRRNSYSGTWVPIVPKDAAQPNGPGAPPNDVKVFVYSTKVRDPDEVYRRLSNPQLPVMVSNKIVTPNTGAMEDLEENFPQTDFSTCIFVYEGREPASESTSTLMIVGGIVAALIGLVCLGLAIWLWRKNAAKAQKKKDRFRDEYDEDRPRKRRSPARDDDDYEDRPRRKPRPRDEDDAPPRRRRPAAREDDDYDDRPRRRSRRDDD